MNQTRWQETKRLFQRASAIDDADQRAAFLDANCADAASRQEVEALLEAHKSDQAFLQESAFAEAAEVASSQREAQMPGRRFGVWRIQRLLDRGGMGAVYLAERVDGGFRQLAALKLLRPGLDHAEVMRRFEQERQILAGLDHPNIAKLLDGGNTEDGQPWLAMEYIEGEPINRWCESQRLNIGARVDLLRRVAETVQYAHQQLVVHRDLKPSNILITANGEPKLLDFGIAKLIHADEDNTLPHLTVAQMLTPNYASPEQVRGDPVTTASDVYALGVLLYRLLTGAQPYHVSSTSPRELLSKICEQEPVKPSASLRRTMRDDPEQAQAIAAGQQTRPKRLLRALQGDLDTIVMTALRKEPTRRYGTPGLLAADLSRWQNALPVTARPDSLGYRGTKFVRRHKVGLAAVVAVVIAMIAGLGVALWQAERATVAQQRAEARFDDLRQLANALVFDLHDAIADLPGSTRARQLLIARALTYLELLSKDAGHNPALASELATAYIKIGDAQGHPERSSLGDVAAAIASYRKALEVRRDLAARDPTSAAAQHELAIALDRVGMSLWWQGHNDEALRHHRQALDARRTAIKFGHADPLYARGLADTHEAIGKVYTWDSRVDEAIAQFDQALAIREAQSAATPSDPDRIAELGSVLVRKGYARSWQDAASSLPIYDRAIELLQQASLEHTNHRPLRFTLARARSRLAESLLDLERYDDSIAEHHRTLRIIEQLVRSDPRDARARGMLAQAHAKFSDTLWGQGSHQLAEQHARRSLKMNSELAAEEPANVGMLQDVAASQQRVARVLEAQNRYAESRSHYEQALALRLRVLQGPAAVATDRRSVASILLDLGDLEYTHATTLAAGSTHASALQTSRKRYQESLAHWQQLIDINKFFAQDQGAVEHVRARLASLKASLDQAD